MDPHCFDADPDPDPAQNLDPDPDPDPGPAKKYCKNLRKKFKMNIARIFCQNLSYLQLKSKKEVSADVSHC